MLRAPLPGNNAASLPTNQTNTSIIEDSCLFAYILEGGKIANVILSFLKASMQ